MAGLVQCVRLFRVLNALPVLQDVDDDSHSRLLKHDFF